MWEVTREVSLTAAHEIAEHKGKEVVNSNIHENSHKKNWKFIKIHKVSRKFTSGIMYNET